MTLVTRWARGRGPLLLGLGLAGCEPTRPERFPVVDLGPVDTSRPDLGPLPDLGPRDLGAPRDAGDVGADADTGTLLDASSLPGCVVGARLDLATAAAGHGFEPAVASRAGEVVVTYRRDVGGGIDLYARRFDGTSYAPAFALTTDGLAESQLHLVALDSDYLLAYVITSGLGNDIATVAFDAVSQSLSGAYDATLDPEADRYPTLLPTSGGALLLFERTDAVTVLRALELAPNGAALGTLTGVGTNVFPSGDFAADANGADLRITYLLDSSTLASFRVGENGVEAAQPGYSVSTLPAGALTGILRTTANSASPRGLVSSATRSARATAYLHRVAASGGFVGVPVEVDDARAVTNPALAAFGGGYVVAYRSGSEVRVRAFDTAGVATAEELVATVSGEPGALELVALGDGSGLLVVFEDGTTTERTLASVSFSCAP